MPLKSDGKSENTEVMKALVLLLLILEIYKYNVLTVDWTILTLYYEEVWIELS